jgi:uncharacterized membrane protein (DUF485 family)
MSHHSPASIAWFALYAIIYFAFVFVNMFAPQWMERTPWPGLNWAVCSGFGLIGLAFALALVHGCFGGRSRKEVNQ